MAMHETAVVDIAFPVAPQEKSPQLYSERPRKKTTDLRPPISICPEVQCSARKDPPSSEHAPASITPNRAEEPVNGASGVRNLDAVGDDGQTVGSGKVAVRSDAQGGTCGETSCDNLDAGSHPGSGSTLTLNLISSSSSEVANVDSGYGSRVNSSSGSYLSSFCPSFDNKQQQYDGTSSPALAQRVVETTHDPFREPFQIPGCSPQTFVYPHGSPLIDASFHQRFREVVNIFRHNTEQSPQLGECVQFIDYTLKMCGTSPTESHPSILVFCRHSEFKALNALLTSKELKYQYCLRRRSRKYPWSASQMPGSEDYKPLFNLYFWRQRRPRTLFWGHSSAGLHRQPSDPSQNWDSRPILVPSLTMCGSVMKLLGDESSFCTLGCVITIGSEWYAITSLHAFKSCNVVGESQSREASKNEPDDSVSVGASTGKGTKLHVVGDNESLHGSDTDLSDGTFDYFIDDIEYESLEDDDEECGQNFEDVLSVAVEDSYTTLRDTGLQDIEIARKFEVLCPTPKDLDETDNTDLDWALVRLTDGRDWRPNAVVHPSASSSPVFLSRVATSQPDQERLVLLVTGKIHQKGVLRSGTSILGGINGKRPSTAWIVAPCEESTLVRGDSGAIVVDVLDNTVYGHVIGSNPIGEIYISPYCPIFEQIQRSFPGRLVAMPDPIRTLRSLIDLGDDNADHITYLEEVYRDAKASMSSTISSRAGSSGPHLTIDPIQSRYVPGQININYDGKVHQDEGLLTEPKHSSAFTDPKSGSTAAVDESYYAPDQVRPHILPPISPADSNPPCNTLYVGNLPIDTSLEELRAIFAKQRGYKRLAFRTKQNGSMCFVEFEDVSCATKAMYELYGFPLSNSVEGGIRLAFSKNPLGVRSSPDARQHGGGTGLNSIMVGSGGIYTQASGLPPGLAAQPGLHDTTHSYNTISSSGFPVTSSGQDINIYASGTNDIGSAATHLPWHEIGP